MKFKKLLFGLAGFPLLLASCSNSMNWRTARQWVANHYEATSDTVNAIAEVEWNYTGTTKGHATVHAIDIYKELQRLSDDEHIVGLKDIFPISEIEKTTNGKMRIINEAPLQMTQLNSGNFETIYEEAATKNIYKVTDGNFSGTYTMELNYILGDTPISATCIRVFNGKGYCTDFGFKANKTLDKDNIVKVKFLAHFLLAE